MPAILFAQRSNRLPTRLLRGDSLPPSLSRRCPCRFFHAIPPSGSHGADLVQRIKGAVGGTHTLYEIVNFVTLKILTLEDYSENGLWSMKR
jgi:hypothetical protein